MDDFDDILLDDYDISGIVEPDTTGTPSNDTPASETTTEEPKKAPRFKFDESFLIDSKGLPLLRTESQFLQFQGKGHEADDLKRLMTYYTVWANNLVPKFRFKDFLRRVKKPASGQRVKVMVQEWQDEYKDKIQARRDALQELSGETVGDLDVSFAREEEGASSEDDNRPLFIPISKEAEEIMNKNKKGKKRAKPSTSSNYKSSATINTSNEDSEDEQDASTKKSRTIIFSDSEDDENPVRKKKTETSTVNGRQHALAILAAKRKQRLQAQKSMEQEEEEQEKEKEPVPQNKPYSDSEEEVDFDEQLRNILESNPSSKQDKDVKEMNKIKETEILADGFDDIVMEDVGDLIVMEKADDDDV